ncbi:MAG TPA: hypothetical protein VFI46_11890 [Jiangellaceae bacterium]|nr:hypothetical protein [Jiangellaceae bacterium]
MAGTWIAAALTAIVLTGCAGDSPDQSGSSPAPRTGGVTIEVRETEFALDAEPRDGLIPARYTFVVRNDGTGRHALAISGPGVDESTQPIPSGAEPVELVVDLQPGTYELWCPVGDHRGRGMQTSLLVEAL